MISNRPYLLRAFYQWIVDSGCTPILVLNAHHPRCFVPEEYVDGDEIVFNISPTAVRDLQLTNKQVEFKASFSGVVHTISASTSAVMAVYAEENGEGLFFDPEEDMEEDAQPVKLTAIDGGGQDIVADTSESDMPQQSSATGRGKPVLRLID